MISRFLPILSIFCLTSFAVQATNPGGAFTHCMTGYFCDSDVDAIRGSFDTPQACYEACLAQGVAIRKTYNFFDLTTDGGKSCWCGDTCTSRTEYQTETYAIGDAVCITHSPTASPSVSPTTTSPSESPTATPTTSSPSDQPTQPPTASPSESPSAAPTPTYSLCSPGQYCDGDTHAQRGIYTAATCYEKCNSLNKGYQFFDVTNNQGQCWCGSTCNNLVTSATNGYRMNSGVCPVSSSPPTQPPAENIPFPICRTDQSCSNPPVFQTTHSGSDFGGCFAPCTDDENGQRYGVATHDVANNKWTCVCWNNCQVVSAPGVTIYATLTADDCPLLPTLNRKTLADNEATNAMEDFKSLRGPVAM